MNVASVVETLIKSSPSLARLSLDLFYTYITLGRRVRRARRAFEKQLILAGMSKDDARHLSACFENLKNSITDSLGQAIRKAH